MALSPRLMRPRAAGTAVPTFTEQGYSRLWCVTEKESGNITVSAKNDTINMGNPDQAYFTVRWWDNTLSVVPIVYLGNTYGSVSKAAAGGQRQFEVFHSYGDGQPWPTPSVALNYSFLLPNNALTQVRCEKVGVSQSQGLRMSGYWAGTRYWTPTNNGYGNSTLVGGTYIPYWYTAGSIYEGDVSNNSLSSAALNQFYADLSSGNGHLYVQGNPGIDADAPTIATAKGYTVFGSEPA